LLERHSKPLSGSAASCFSPEPRTLSLLASEQPVRKDSAVWTLAADTTPGDPVRWPRPPFFQDVRSNQLRRPPTSRRFNPPLMRPVPIARVTPRKLDIPTQRTRFDVRFLRVARDLMLLRIDPIKSPNQGGWFFSNQEAKAMANAEQAPVSLSVIRRRL